MSRQVQLPGGGGYLNDEGTAQRQSPTGDYINQTGVTYQTAYAASDIANAGSWKRSSDNATTGLYTMIDETIADDADYVYSPDDPTTQLYEFKLGPLNDPVSSTDHVITLRLAATGLDTNFDLNLVQGTTVLDSWTENVTVAAGTVQRTRTLSGAVADSITDYSDLRLRIVARA